MPRLQGDGLGAGVVMGIACPVQMRRGIALAPAASQLSFMNALENESEKPDIVLVCAEYNAALALSEAISWGNVVGIASADTPASIVITDVPAVTGIPALLEVVNEPMLMVLDANRGLVIADPEGMEVAFYQAELNHLAPRTRFFLEGVHLPAETQDGKTVLAPGTVHTMEEVKIAIEQGADMVYVPAGCSAIVFDGETDEQRESLLHLIESTAGKPILLGDDYSIPPMVLLEAGVKAEITLALPLQMHLDGYGLGELAEELQQAEADCVSSGALSAPPRLAAAVRAEDLPEEEMLAFFVEKLAMRGATRLITQELEAKQLDMLTACARSQGMPVYVEVNNCDEEHLKTLIAAGAGGLIVPASHVQHCKQFIRTCSFSESREQLLDTLQKQEENS